MALIKLFTRYSFPDAKLNVVLRDYRVKVNEIIDQTIGTNIGNLSLYDTDQSNILTLKWGEDDSNDREFEFLVNKGDRALDLSGNLIVESTSTLNQDYTTDAGVIFAGLTINGDSDLDGAVTINDSNADKDFRVEGSGATYTHLLFTDAGVNMVGINEDAPKALFHIRGATCADYAGLHPDTYLLLENDDNTYIQLQGATNGVVGIVFTDDNYNPPAGLIRYDLANDQIEFGVGTNEILRLQAGPTFDFSGMLTFTGGIHVQEPTFSETPLFERSGQTSDANWIAARLLATKTSAMGDGFGSALMFTIQDDEATINPIGIIGAIRDGADNSGKLTFSTYSAGSDSVKVTIDKAGLVTLSDGSSISLQEDITFTGATTENLIKIPDNLADALSIQEGSNKYLTFATTNDVEDITLHKATHITHTATQPNVHALEIEADAAGYGDIKALEIDYISGNISAGEDEAIILLNIDETAATGGDVFGLEVLATEGSAGVYGMKVGVVIGPVHQDSGTFINPDTATDNTPSTNVTFMQDGLIGNTTAIFESNSEYILIGDASPFEEIEFIITTGASGAGIKPTFWYSTAGSHTFTQFTPIDGTDAFKHTGVVAWDASDLTSHGVNTDTSTYDIKIIRTRNSLGTTPILGFAKTAATTEYIWDKDGDVNIRNLLISDGGNIGSASDTDAIAIASGGEVTLSQTLILSDVVNASTDTDKFLVLDGSNNVDYRTGANILSDIGGLANIVEDTTPQLGGDLDLNSKNIDFPSVANVSDCKDEDNMASDSATMLATQQSIKAYVDASGGADEKVGIDSGATAGYLGALIGDGVLRFTTNEFTLADGGNFVTLSLADHNTARTALGLAIGTDVLAEKTIGIADNNLLEVDHASPADDDYAKFTVNGLEGRSYAEVLTDLSGQAGAAFAWNSQNLTGVGTIGSGAITSTGLIQGTSIETTAGNVLAYTAGGDISMTARTVAAGAHCQVILDGIAAKNCSVSLQTATVGQYIFGIRAASANFVIWDDVNNVAALDITQGAVPNIALTGNMTNSVQPAFNCTNSAEDADVTGDGTNATVDFNVERFDQGGDFATDTFTAPVDGRYQLNATVLLSGLSTDTFEEIYITMATSNIIYYDSHSTATIYNAADDLNASISVLADMDANDTAHVTIRVAGGTKTVDVSGHESSMITVFSGALIC